MNVSSSRKPVRYRAKGSSETERIECHDVTVKCHSDRDRFFFSIYFRSHYHSPLLADEEQANRTHERPLRVCFQCMVFPQAQREFSYVNKRWFWSIRMLSFLTISFSCRLFAPTAFSSLPGHYRYMSPTLCACTDHETLRMRSERISRSYWSVLRGCMHILGGTDWQFDLSFHVCFVIVKRSHTRAYTKTKFLWVYCKSCGTIVY